MLLSHYHADHSDRLVSHSVHRKGKLDLNFSFALQVKATLRKGLPIVTTPYAHHALTTKNSPEGGITTVTPLDTRSSASVEVTKSSEGDKKEHKR